MYMILAITHILHVCYNPVSFQRAVGSHFNLEGKRRRAAAANVSFGRGKTGEPGENSNRCEEKLVCMKTSWDNAAVVGLVRDGVDSSFGLGRKD